MQTRKVYEKYPYPTADKTALTNKRWNLVPMEWINAFWQTEGKNLAPKRILVAGCGTGSEAFALRRLFPKAQIVGVDFSPRSIAIARDLQKRARAMRNIQFFMADLKDRHLGKSTGGEFDFISCHGVLSYIPNPGKVLANLKRQLKPDGALYLGVNGAEHFSTRGRLFLPTLGVELAELRDEQHLRKVLKLWDAIWDERDHVPLSQFGIGILAGDLFGPLVHNFPLHTWIGLAREAGLHFQNSFFCWRAVRTAMEKDYAQLLIPKSRAEVCRLLGHLSPEYFHRLLFTRAAPANPPWENQQALSHWRPALTNLYAARLPKPSRSGQRLRGVTFSSQVMNTRLDWQMPEWEVEIIRQSNGKRTLGEILQEISDVVPPRLLRQQLYVLHQLLVITLLPNSTAMRH